MALAALLIAILAFLVGLAGFLTGLAAWSIAVGETRERVIDRVSGKRSANDH